MHRAGLKLAWYAVGVPAVAGLLAPWVYRLAEPWGFPFPRIFSRVLLVVAGLGLWWLLRHRSWRDVGLVRARDAGWDAGLGVGLGLGTVAWFATGWHGDRWLEFGGTALGVAVVEELFYRGGLQTLFRDALPRPVAVVIVAGIYSAAHFVRSPDLVLNEVTWRSGFEYWGYVVAGWARAGWPWWALVNLWWVGALLGLTVGWRGNLYLAMGLHAGWVFGLRMMGAGAARESHGLWLVILGLGGVIAGWHRYRQA